MIGNAAEDTRAQRWTHDPRLSSQEGKLPAGANRDDSDRQPDRLRFPREPQKAWRIGEDDSRTEDGNVAAWPSPPLSISPGTRP